LQHYKPNMKIKKIAFLYTHPIQYFTPFHKILNNLVGDRAMVFYCLDTSNGYYDNEFNQSIKWDIQLLEGYKFKFLKPSILSKLSKKFRYYNSDVLSNLKQTSPDIIIIHGWGYLTAIKSIILARLLNIKIWIRGETPLSHELKKRGVKKFIHILFLKAIFSQIDKFLVIGKENKAFYKYLCVSENKFIYAPYCVDNSDQKKKSEILPSKDSIKQQIGIPTDSFVVLFCGKLIDKKNPLDLLKAFHLAKIENSYLLYIGDGEMQEILKNYINKNSLDNVLMLGFKNQSEMPLYYKAASIFVLPSGLGETWGLVVNEAMNNELPIIVSDMVGSSKDLVIEGENGYIFPEHDIEKLSHYLTIAANDINWLRNAGEKSKQMIQHYSYDTIITNIIKHITYN